MDLYNGKINEFVDWVSGKNSLTGLTSTGGLQVSGGAIRELLQRKLKEPFYMFEDTANNKYRMFSSEDAYAIWKENPTDNQDLELFNFVRPSDYKLELTATNSDGFNNKFVRYGDINSTGTRIAYSWNIYNDEGDSSDSLSATYTISNVASGASTTFTRWYNRSDANPDFSIYDYLQPGENVVTIECKGTTTGARNTKTFTIVLLQINLTSTFKFYEKQYSNLPLQIPYVFERNNTSGTAKIHFRIDNGGSGKEYTRDVVLDGPTRITEIQMAQTQLAEGTHTLQIWAEAKYNDGNTTVNSNLLYYTFTVASSIVGSTNKFINISTSFDSGDFPLSNLMLNATQYESQVLQWGYYTDSLQTNTSISVTWKLLDGLDDANPTELGTMTANSQEKAPNLSFIPTIYTEENHYTYLCAYNGNTLINSFPIYIVKNNKVIVNETGFYETKMSAYGKTNDSTTKDIWQDESGNVSTTFTGIQWNTNSGWYNNSFRTSGTNEYAIINAQPFNNFDFSNGKTIEIEFESEKVSEVDDAIIVIGNPYGARIEITPDTATLYDNSQNEVVHTNYKSNERLKLAFIINSFPDEAALRTVESGLAYIINNGILERAASASGKSFNTPGTIKIGGTASGVRVYNLRVYNYALTYMQAYNNYLYDSDNKARIADSNAILDQGGSISFDLCKNKIDTILISGDLSNILSGQSDKDTSTTDVTIERFCPSDSSKNFKINNVQIRKHGQSTLNYPITSMKFWLNKSQAGTIPLYESTQQADLLLNKNRYVMKSSTDSGKPSIPANKFVLQANYADSSGTHNGGFERLIQNTWFNAQIDGEFKLRTEPQLFSTSQVVHHNNTNIGEDGTWVEGYSNVPSKGDILWNDITNQEFPYDIRIAPDSFPCAVFYYNENGSQTRTFLGQYVWMDDKKSDFCYGERSIYAVPADPFCLTNTHKDDDTDQNLVWDNKNVLRVEVVGSNTPFTSYMTHTDFTRIMTVEANGRQVRKYNWEDSFEMIYPDEDDIAEDDAKAGIDKFNANSKYVRKIQPFIDFHEWVVSTYHNQTKFEEEAAQHLDLYKMAAYYIFVMRFGLVDSLERNAQIKTYDGVHWHYEPWDMDIALGNKNDGGIAFDPPIDRNTKLPGSQGTYAISGRNGDANGVIVTSNWLFDALEAWDEWINEIVPKVADALFVAGLNYNNITNMLDNNYAAKWCEIMYNQSGFFKYVESGEGDPTWLSWLQGARMTHRHWWLSNSMDYYDAKWFCGDYKNHYIYLRANVAAGSNQNVVITPNKSTYMSVTKDGVLQTTQSVDKTHPLNFSMSIGSATKNPILFYGANFMEEIDLSQIAHGLDGITLDGVYSDVLGSPLKKINVGVAITENTDQNVDADYTCTLASLGCQIQGNARVFQNLQSLNIRGQVNQTSLNGLVYGNNTTELQEVYAMGSGLVDFYSSQSGNNFTDIELPDTVYTIWMNNSTWQDMTFWHTTASDTNIQDILADRGLVYGTDAYYDAIAQIAAETPELLENIATIKEVNGIPTTVHNVSFLGTTGSTLSSLLFVRNWLNALVAANADLSQYNLIMDKINWSDATVGANNLLTYNELELLSQLGNQTSLKGYLVLRDTGTDLTAAQLNEIKSWFGDTVFTKNSSGLVVDHKRQYIQINIGGDVTVAPWTYTDPVSGNVYEGNITLTEGHAASLNATQFSLAEDDQTDYQWSVGPVNSNDSSGRYNGVMVQQAEDSIDKIAYLNSVQSTVGEDYYIRVYTAVSGVPYSTVVKVIAASYPTDLFINTRAESNIALRTAPGYIEFPQTGASASFYVDSAQEYTAEVRSITYSLTRLSDNTTISYITGGGTTQLDNFTDPYITVTKSNSLDCIKITADSAMPNTAQLYTLTATVLFTSSKTETITFTLVVQDDTTAIVSSSKTTMWNPISAAWTAQFGSAFAKNNMFKIDLMALTHEIDFSSSGSNLPNLVTYNNDYLFKYLVNCEGVILDGCTSLQNTADAIIGVDKNQFNFSNMTKLKKFHAQNCSGLTGTIDLTMCPGILSVDVSGTTINVNVPQNAVLTKYEVGAPTSISLINPTVLTPTEVVVDSYGNLNSLDLINIPNNKSFSMFDKIMQTYIVGGILYSSKYLDANNNANYITVNDANAFASSDILINPTHTIRVESDATVYVYVFYGDTKGSGSNAYQNANISYMLNNATHIRFCGNKQNNTYVRIIDTTSDSVLFEWRA